MPATRSQEKNQGRTADADDATTGDKHKIDNESALAPKARKKNDEKQTTLEDTMDIIPTKDAKDKSQHGGDGPKRDASRNGKVGDDRGNNDNEVEHPTETAKSTNGSSAVEPGARDGSQPSNLLEKGIIYFFFRGRVGIDEPESVSDIARSYIILRPIEKDARLGDGPIGDAGNSRLCAIPMKVLPQSGRDRWISFVEKADVSFETLKQSFLAGNDYETKTAGTRHSPAATPVGEGVYAITSTGRESHLVYLLTLPENLGEVQHEIGLKDKGSFIISTRNPQYPPPGNAQLPEGPEYPKQIIDSFRALRWAPTQPSHLDVVKTQFLLIGESSGLEKATQPDKKDQQDDKKKKEEPIEEIEKLEHEDTKRMKHLGEDDTDAIFKDLEAHAKDHPKLQTTF